MDIDDVFLTKVMLFSLEPVRCWPGVSLFHGMALLALGWSYTGLGVTVAVDVMSVTVVRMTVAGQSLNRAYSVSHQRKLRRHKLKGP